MKQTELTRRDLLGLAAKGAASGIYNDLSPSQKSALTLQAAKAGDGYEGVVNFGVQVA